MLLVLIINTSFLSNENEKSPAAQRAEYILYIINNVTWPEDAEFDEFVIGVLEAEPYISKELEIQSKGKTTADGKPVTIKMFSDINDLTPTQMLYVNRIEGYDISRVLREVSGKGTLLISENYEFQTSMINFLIVNDLLRFEINLARMESEGFRAAPLFAAQSIKRESDWVNLYHQVEDMYFREQEIVRQQSLEIKEQQEIIAKQLSVIEEQDAEIYEQQQQILQQTERLDRLNSVISEREKELDAAVEVLDEKTKQINKSIEQIRIAEKELKSKTEEVLQKEKMIDEQDKLLIAQLQEIEKQKVIIVLAGILLVILIGLGYFIYRSYLIKKRANIALKQKNEQIRKQKDEIEKQRDVATRQRDTIAKQNKNIQDSINYASRIQEAVLPPKELLSYDLKNYFILNKPKEVVSGDYYWMANKNEQLIIAAADCTGHGVPGAFMSMLGVAFLNEIVNKIEVLKANEILNMLREYVIDSLRQTGKSGEANDGMDIALCILNTKNYNIQYAGANNPLYIVRPVENVKEDDEQLKEHKLIRETDKHHLYRVKADLMPVAIHRRADVSFKNHNFQMNKGDSFYIFSDGYVDQFGGPHGKRYSSGKFAQKIIDIQTLNMQEQFDELDIEIERWKSIPDDDGNKHQQIDDILVIGVKL